MVCLSVNGCLLSRKHSEQKKKKKKREHSSCTQRHIFSRLVKHLTVSVQFVRICSTDNIMTLKISSRKKNQFPLLYYILNLHCTLKCSSKSGFTFHVDGSLCVSGSLIFIFTLLYITLFLCPDAPNSSFNGSKINPAMVSDCRFSFSSGYWICGWFWGFTLGHACCIHRAQRS